MTYASRNIEQALVAVRTLQLLITERIWQATNNDGMGLASIQHERNNRIYYFEQEWLNAINQNPEQKLTAAAPKLEQARVPVAAAPTMTLAFNYMKKQMPQYLSAHPSDTPTMEKLKGP